jgi:hypothetical protein
MMKLTRMLILISFIVVQQFPVTARAQTQSEIFVLPSGYAGEPYQKNIEAMLREKYNLKLEAGSRSSAFQWSFAGGELPSGLEVKADGTIVGTPDIDADKIFAFRARVADTSSANAEPLELRFSLSIKAPKIRLVSVSGPRLITADSLSVPAHYPAGAGNLNSHGIARHVLQSSTVNGSTQVVSAPSADKPSGSPAAAKANDRSKTDGAEAVGAKSTVIRIDARGGGFIGEKRFDRRQRVTVVVDNKNPYVYKYKYSRDAKPVSESAIAAFLPLLGGIVGEFAKPPEPVTASTTPKPPTPSEVHAAFINRRPASPAFAAPIDPCSNRTDADKAVDDLNQQIKTAKQTAEQTNLDLKQLKRNVSALKEKHDAAKGDLYDASKTRDMLSEASRGFLNVTREVDTFPPQIEGYSTALERQQADAASFASDIKDIVNKYPGCVAAEEAIKVRDFSDQLSSAAKKNEELLGQVGKIIVPVNENRKKVDAILKNPEAFVEEHVEGDFDETNSVTLKLELTPIEKETPAAGPYTTEVRFGGAPFFSISGGMGFSSLRKIEYQRVQGFQLDSQGNQVLVNGQPTLTTVIGQKEGSTTRISPMVMLNGRLFTPRSPKWLNGVHASLGVTGKNDNKGTDVEFLLGPSFSLLENNLFFTVGGYAGKQQRLEGDFFRGMEAPASLGELPIRKDYRWGFSFAISYRIPASSKSK